MDLVRLACVRHAASVRPEPGSNSPSRSSLHIRRCFAEIGEPVRHGYVSPTGIVQKHDPKVILAGLCKKLNN